MSVTLTSQPKFSSALGVLQKAVNDGQGISSFDPSSASENEDHQQNEQEAQVIDEHVAQEGQEFAAGEEQYEQHHDAYTHEYANEHEQYQEGENGEYQEGQEFTEEPNVENQADQLPEDGYHDEINYEDFDEHEEYPDPEDFDQYQESGTNIEDFGAPEDQGNTEGGLQTETQEEKPSEIVEPDSAASSMTVHGDRANDVTGEYDPEDLIDWDDDLLTGSSETYADHGDDDFSKLLTEYDAEASGNVPEPPKKSSKQTDIVLDISESANELSALHPSEDHKEEQAILGPESEDFLTAEIDHQLEGDADAADSTGEQYQEDPDEGLIQYEDDTFNEADYVDYDNQGENELGEDDEQFHTALELLDGDQAEQGPGNADATALSNQPHAEALDEYDIGYDDDDFAEPENVTKGSTDSPLGKRSFEADEDELDFEEPELKKARSD